ncbi:hypothetical protein ABK040_014384 [Willaertia magna]
MQQHNTFVQNKRSNRKSLSAAAVNTSTLRSRYYRHCRTDSEAEREKANELGIEIEDMRMFSCRERANTDATTIITPETPQVILKPTDEVNSVGRSNSFLKRLISKFSCHKNQNVGTYLK